MGLCYFFFIFASTYATTLTITNNCNDIIWPAVLPIPGSPLISPSGLSLNIGDSETLPVPSGWSGHVWARTHYAPTSVGKFSCATGDCGSSAVDCNGSDGKFSPPATVADFTINELTSPDTYSVSVVDGYNLPVKVVPTGAAARGCTTVGCAMDYESRNCPAELRVSYGGGNESVGLKSACEAFEEAEYCCGNNGNNYSSSKIACKQNSYSEMFKNWCPQARTFAYDNNGTTFTCDAENYVVNFCGQNSGFSSTRTGTGTRLPENQGSDIISKFGTIIGVGVVFGVIGIILIIWFCRRYFKFDLELALPSCNCELTWPSCDCTCCSIFLCSVC